MKRRQQQKSDPWVPVSVQSAAFSLKLKECSLRSKKIFQLSHNHFNGRIEVWGPHTFLSALLGGEQAGTLKTHFSSRDLAAVQGCVGGNGVLLGCVGGNGVRNGEQRTVKSDNC